MSLDPKPASGTERGLTFSLSQASLAALFERDGPSAVQDVPVVRFEGAERLSGQLLDFAHPLVGHLHHPGEEPEREGLLKLAVLAWNAALSDPTPKDKARARRKREASARRKNDRRKR